ncbi:hypothetical protein GF361_03575 [Candidatus Woesearchaeota archaeon]|nr:hypothetical protein [Candidatus Woesearchaeota archaeon]
MKKRVKIIATVLIILFIALAIFFFVFNNKSGSGYEINWDLGDDTGKVIGEKTKGNIGEEIGEQTDVNVFDEIKLNPFENEN